MRFDAIRKVHPEVTNLEGEDKAYDIDGNIVKLNEGMVAVHLDIMEREAKEQQERIDLKSELNGKLDRLVVTLPEISRIVIHPAEGDQEAYSERVVDREAMTLDGNNMARQDMMSAIQSAPILEATAYSWKQADNTWAILSIEDLREALALAIFAKGQILGA